MFLEYRKNKETEGMKVVIKDNRVETNNIKR